MIQISANSLAEEMPSNTKPAPFRPSGLIEFEFTDVKDAHRVAEQSVAAANVERLMPGYWEEQRRKSTPSDRALTGAGIDWVLALPTEARPKALCEQFPRIANHLAEHWHDLPNTQLALMRLLADERGQRKGFSLQIQQEIGRLAAHVQALLEAQPTQPATL
jgi:hypothetical protein